MKALFWSLAIAGWLAAFAWCAAGCSIVKPACDVIHIADETCRLIAVPLADGGVEYVRPTAPEWSAFASRTKAAHASQDGGL